MSGARGGRSLRDCDCGAAVSKRRRSAGLVGRPGCPPGRPKVPLARRGRRPGRVRRLRRPRSVGPRGRTPCACARCRPLAARCADPVRTRVARRAGTRSVESRALVSRQRGVCPRCIRATGREVVTREATSGRASAGCPRRDGGRWRRRAMTITPAPAGRGELRDEPADARAVSTVVTIGLDVVPVPLIGLAAELLPGAHTEAGNATRPLGLETNASALTHRAAASSLHGQERPANSPRPPRRGGVHRHRASARLGNRS